MCMCILVNMCAYAYAHMYIYICAFFCSECCVLFRTGVLSTNACAVVCVIQMFLWHQRKHLRHIRCRLCTCVHIHIYVYIHAYVYACVCASRYYLTR